VAWPPAPQPQILQPGISCTLGGWKEATAGSCCFSFLGPLLPPPGPQAKPSLLQQKHPETLQIPGDQPSWTEP
jgi:hypothetical protein